MKAFIKKITNDSLFGDETGDVETIWRFIRDYGSLYVKVEELKMLYEEYCVEKHGTYHVPVFKKASDYQLDVWDRPHNHINYELVKDFMEWLCEKDI